jgi:hypothetical protein
MVGIAEALAVMRLNGTAVGFVESRDTETEGKVGPAGGIEPEGAELADGGAGGALEEGGGGAGAGAGGAGAGGGGAAVAVGGGAEAEAEGAEEEP